jgi:hypothetical protein
MAALREAGPCSRFIVLRPLLRHVARAAIVGVGCTQFRHVPSQLTLPIWVALSNRCSGAARDGTLFVLCPGWSMAFHRRCWPQSVRSACIGSMRIARRVGRTIAARAIVMIAQATAANVSGSIVGTS